MSVEALLFVTQNNPGHVFQLRDIFPHNVGESTVCQVIWLRYHL